MSKNKTSNYESYNVVGMSYHTEEFMRFAKSNPDYSLSRKKIIENGLTNKRIMQYNFDFDHIELIEEPDNEYDPNAIKVLADGAMIGYIRKEECTHVKDMIRKGEINRVELEVFLYGNYKGVFGNVEDGYEQDSDSYDKGFCKINIYTKDTPSAENPKNNVSDVQGNGGFAYLVFMVIIAVCIYDIRFAFIISIFWIIKFRKHLNTQKSMQKICTILATVISLFSILCLLAL